MKRTAVAVCAALVVIAASVFAQATPNFAGKWTVIPDANTPAGGMGGLGQSATIAQDAATLTITRTTQMGEFVTTYKLDGSDSKNTLKMQDASIDMVSQVKPDGGKLVVTTSMSFDGNPVQTSMTMSLDAAGNLVVESTRPDFQGGGGPITTKMTYKKN